MYSIMNSLSFSSVVNDFASDESVSTVVASGKDQIGSKGWDVKPSFIFKNNMGFISNEINIGNQVCGDMGFSPLMKNSTFNPIMTPSQNSFSEESESNCGVESISRESGLIDLKLGRFIDQKEAQIFNSSKISHTLSPSEVYIPSKRPRDRSFGSSTPVCKVHGCNKSLSNCKEYHKRHRVCEVHSKTSKVIVNGIEQRFCQQCSRFHLLCEFDDGKRSCRKRLAGHNERRRKPHVGARKLVPSYNISVEVNEFKGSTGTKSGFAISNDLSSPYDWKYETNGRSEMNLEDRRAHDLYSISCINTDEQIYSKSFSPCNFETNPRVIDGGISSSESALSLLSSQSGTTSNHSPRIQTSNSQSHSMMFPGCHYEPTQEFVQLHQHDMNPLLGFEGSLVKFGITNSNDQVYRDEGCTVNLLCLSSQLERVEHQKRNSQVNPANGVAIGFGIT